MSALRTEPVRQLRKTSCRCCSAQKLAMARALEPGHHRYIEIRPGDLLCWWCAGFADAGAVPERPVVDPQEFARVEAFLAGWSGVRRAA